MKKELIGIALSIITAASVLAGCGNTGSSGSTAGAASGDVVVLTMAEVNPADTITGRMDRKFCEEVERLSNGTVKIDLQEMGVLGTESTVLDKMVEGSDKIDLARISVSALNKYGCEKAALLTLPYVFESRDHFWKFAESDLAQVFLQEPEELGLGVSGLFYGEEGFRNFFTVDPVEGIDDLEGMKIRVSSDPVMSGLVENLGAEAADYDFTELYSALQTGIIDGAEQPVANYRYNAFQEVAPNMILDGHTIGAVEVIISDKAVNKLSDEQLEAVIEAGKIASGYNRGISEEAEAEALEKLEKEGVSIVEVEDKTPWQEAAKPVVEESVGVNADIYDQLVNIK